MTKAYSISVLTSKQTKKTHGGRLTQKDFIQRAVDAHGDLYDYSNAVYCGSKIKVEIICQKHGSFWQAPSHHYEGRGCQRCGHEITATARRKTTAGFIAAARKVHGDLYSYTKVKYKLKDDKVVIGCREHGDFKQSANNHVRGQGCPKCSNKYQGYNKTNFKNACDKNNNGNGLMYVIKCQEGDEEFYKIGVTSRSVSDRFCSVVEMPYKYSEVYLIENTASYIFDIERRCHSLLSDSRYKPLIPFDGQTECFTTIKPIEQLLKRLSSTDQLQLIA